MKILNWKINVGLFFMLLMSSCVEPYLPEVMEAPNSYLVVNGFINSDGQTTIQLLRTQNLNDEASPPHENGAIVMIVAEDGEKFSMVQPQSSIYVTAPLKLDTNKKYSLFIRTRDGKEYASEFVEIKPTPAIDEVTWKPVNGEVQLYVSTHDPENKSWYYRWEYEDTWQFRSAFYTTLVYDNGIVRQRDERDEQIWVCWKSEKSSTIEVGTSKHLVSDVVNNYKLVSIPANSEKVSVKYSVLVKQQVLSREEYDYMQILKKNSESIGTLFDPLPSQLHGNIKCLSDPTEPVIGFVGATNVQTKRVFIDVRELPKEWSYFKPECEVDTLFLSRNTVRERFDNGVYVPVDEFFPNGSLTPNKYTFALKACVDCRVTGTNVKPDFWE